MNDYRIFPWLKHLSGQHDQDKHGSGLGDLPDADLLVRVKELTPKERLNSPLFAEYERRRDARGGIGKDNPQAKPDKEIAKDLGGFEKTLSPATRAKAIEQMNTQKIINGKPQTRRQYVDAAVAAGASVGNREGQRALVHKDGSYTLQSAITKTALDYAEWKLRAYTH